MSVYKKIQFDCKHFRGSTPCKPNKERGKVCDTCNEYKPFDKRILIIKLGAIGDVIRTTPLITGFKKLYPDCHITWMTHSPDVLPKDEINEILTPDFLSFYKLENTAFDIALNLDKETEACALLARVNSKEKFGYILQNQHIAAATPAGEHKLVTGLFDNLSRQNTKHYLDEIFEICNLKFEGEKYLINFNLSLADEWNSVREEAHGKKIIGLNTGCGVRWQTRLWPRESWVELIQKLQDSGYYPVVLGGKDEDDVNSYYVQATGCFYPGHFPLDEFIALVSHCDVVVTTVSMMMHIALALDKKLVLFNNIFNAHEFHLYGQGEIIEPTSGCDCYYGNTCTRTRHCMSDISVATVFDSIKKLAH
ncbi:MAG: glycosyltransferase family 9 protein [Flavobacteriales bacterium]|nr:glycosyltransferase family 9 protein [Flavobacteriales bacterium]